RRSGARGCFRAPPFRCPAKGRASPCSAWRSLGVHSTEIRSLLARQATTQACSRASCLSSLFHTCNLNTLHIDKVLDAALDVGPTLRRRFLRRRPYKEQRDGQTGCRLECENGSIEDKIPFRGQARRVLSALFYGASGSRQDAV